MGLFSGLEKFGLGKLEKMDVFEEEKKRDAVEHPKKDQKPQIQEEDLLFDKSFTCPVCDEEFHSKMVRTGKVKLLSADSDLRPKYQMVDSLKYDALVCPHCGYASQRYFLLYNLRTPPKRLVPAVPLIFPQRMQSMLCILPITSAHAVMYMAHGAKNKMWTVQYDPLQPVNLPSSAAFSHNGFSKYFYH